jgi:endonuclease/exonuclease/phosphatase family metal-dependent hydrolase
MQLLPRHHAEYGAGLNLPADHRDAAGCVIHRRRQFGNLTFSRYPIRYVRHHLLPKYGSTGPISIQRSALECVIDTPLGALRVINTHLTHLSGATRTPQVERLKQIHGQARMEGSPVCGDVCQTYWTLDEPLPEPPERTIIMGDFNFEPDSTEYTLMVGPLSEYGGRVTNPEGFVDAWVAAGHEENEGTTADIHGRPVRLDYMFLSPWLANRIVDCRIDSDAVGSDHQPVWLELDES